MNLKINYRYIDETKRTGNGGSALVALVTFRSLRIKDCNAPLSLLTCHLSRSSSR